MFGTLTLLQPDAALIPETLFVDVPSQMRVLEDVMRDWQLDNTVLLVGAQVVFL